MHLPYENIDLICESLEKYARKTKLSLDFKSTNSADSIWSSTVCDIYNEDCIWRRCDVCGASKVMDLFDAFLPYDNVKIDVPQWETVMVESKKKRNVEQKDDVETVENMNEESDEEVQENQKKESNTSYTKKSERRTIKETLRMLEEKLETFSIHNHTTP